MTDEFRAVIEHEGNALGWEDGIPTVKIGDESCPLGGKDGVGASKLVWLLNVPFKAVEEAVNANYDRYNVTIEGWPEHVYRPSIYGESTDYIDAVLLYALFAGDVETRTKALGWVDEMKTRIGDDVALALREESMNGLTDETKAEASRLLEEWREHRKKIPSRTDEELKELVLDMLGNRIFTSAQVGPHENLGMVFMPLALGAFSVPDAALPPRPDVPPRPELPEEPDLPSQPVQATYPEPPKEIKGNAQEIERIEHEIRWDRMKPEAVEEYKAGIEAENKRLIDAHEAEKKEIDDRYAAEMAEWQKKVDAIQEAYEDAVKNFDATVEAWKAENAEVLAEDEEWKKAHEAWAKEMARNVGIFYEYYDQAGPRSCNGLPMFMSMRILNWGDWERVWKAYEKEAKRREEIEV